MRRKNPVNTHRERMKRYPYGYEPPELDGTKYLDLCPEFLGEDELFADLPENPTRFPPHIDPAPKASKTDPPRQLYRRTIRLRYPYPRRRRFVKKANRELAFNVSLFAHQ